MYKIINKQVLGQDIKRLDIEAPQIAASFQPGQFVMICSDDGAEWIPLSIVDVDTRRGVISIIFQEKGDATRQLGSLPIHEKIFSVSGPFGSIQTPRQIGVVVCAATDVSAAQLLPVCRAYQGVGNKVIGVLSARTKSELILEPQMRIVCNRLLLSTEDGTYHRRGSAAGTVKELFDEENIDLVYSIGDTQMMRDIAIMTHERNIPNLMQVHTVMSCGRGMCGSCRVKVDQQLVLGCEEGPEFDGHQMDFDYLKHRMEQRCQCNESKETEKTVKGVFKYFFDKD